MAGRRGWVGKTVVGRGVLGTGCGVVAGKEAVGVAGCVAVVGGDTSVCGIAGVVAFGVLKGAIDLGFVFGAGILVLVPLRSATSASVSRWMSSERTCAYWSGDSR